MSKKVFDYPNIRETFHELLEKLLNESLRGAVIIGTAVVEEYLTDLIIAVLPKKTNNYKNRLLKYPGALGSFSAKIELLFAFRIIDNNLYESLNYLRRLRNKAAHSSDEITITELNKELEKVFNIGALMSTHIRNSAIKMLVDFKIMTIEPLFEKDKYSELEKRLEIQKIIQDDKIIETLEKQIPYWELIYGLSILCAMIEYEREKINQVFTNKSTWISSSEKK